MAAAKGAKDKGSKQANDEPEGGGDLKRLRVHGTISFRSGKSGVAGYTVVAFDQDIGRKNLLGRATTDATGYYQIDYTEAKFRHSPSERGGADVFVRVYDKKDELLHETNTIPNAPIDVVIDVEVPDRVCVGRGKVIMTAKTTHLDPEELHSNPAFTQGVIAPAAQTLYVGGQLGTDSTGTLLNGIEAQAAQAMRNVLTVLAAAGTGPEHVVKLNIYLVNGVDAQVGYAASRSVWGNHRTAITVVSTAGHARPGALVEIDAVAIIPE